MPTVLIIEDSPTQARHFALMLEDAGFQVETAGRLDEGVRRIQKGGFDALLLDLTLPDSEGLKTFLTARREAPDTPLVVLTNVDDEALAATTLQQGAQDYLVKGEVNQNWLVRSIQHAMARRHKKTAPEPAADASRTRHILDVGATGSISIVRFNQKKLLDAGDIALIGEKLMRLVETGCRKMVLSFASVDYASNGMMSALLAVRRKMMQAGGAMVLCELSEPVQEHLTVRQFHRLFEIRDDEQAAVSYLESQ